MLETFLLVFAISLDSFVVSVAYGTNKIKLPFMSIALMSLISSGILGFSLALGGIIKNWVPLTMTPIISFVILFLLGVYYFCEGLIKNYLQKQKDQNKKLCINFQNICIGLDIYLDETKADFNHSKTLNLKEAAYLSTLLSLDSLAVGFASSIYLVNYWQIVGICFLFNLLSILLGTLLGKKISEKNNVNLSWLSGILLIILAFKNII